LEKLPEISSFRTVRDLNDATGDIFVGIKMFGKTLEHYGIFHGDILIVKLTKNFNSENLYVWNTPHGKTAKFAEKKLAEIALHNGGDWRETFFQSEVEMLGVVVRIERDLTVKR